MPLSQFPHVSWEGTKVPCEMNGPSESQSRRHERSAIQIGTPSPKNLGASKILDQTMIVFQASRKNLEDRGSFHLKKSAEKPSIESLGHPARAPKPLARARSRLGVQFQAMDPLLRLLRRRLLKPTGGFLPARGARRGVGFPKASLRNPFREPKEK